MEDTKKYELMVIIHPDLGENAIVKRLEEIRKLIKNQKGEIFFEDIWGMRDLAYPIKKHERGYYAVLSFTLLPEMLQEIDTTLKLENEVVRHMIITLPFTYEPKNLAMLEAEYIEQQKQNPSAKKTDSKVAPVPSASVHMKNADAVKSPKTSAPPKEEIKKTSSIEDVDAKLKSIIDNPDINF